MHSHPILTTMILLGLYITMALWVGAAEVGKGRHRRRRRAKEREKQLMLQSLKEERDERRRQNAEKQRNKNRKLQADKELKMSDNSWRTQEPAFTHIAISFSLLKKDGSIEVLDKFREMYEKGKFQGLILIADDVSPGDDIESVRKWLSKNNHEWAFSHTVFNTSEIETPSQFTYRVLKAFNVDGFIVDANGSGRQNWVRSAIKSLRVHSFNNWPDALSWAQRLNNKYYLTCAPDAAATEIINTTRVKPTQTVKQETSIKPGIGWLD